MTFFHHEAGSLFCMAFTVYEVFRLAWRAAQYIVRTTYCTTQCSRRKLTACSNEFFLWRVDNALDG